MWKLKEKTMEPARPPDELIDPSALPPSTSAEIARGRPRSESDIGDFTGTAGTFRFDGLGRVELSAADKRIRLWSSLTADTVWKILGTLAHYQRPR